jgi:hypothetical protein
MALTAKGEPNGLATLDDDGKVPVAQLPGDLGDFEQGVAVANVAAMTSAAPIAGGESPTEAEFNALRADVVAIRATLLALQNSLRDANFIAT